MKTTAQTQPPAFLLPDLLDQSEAAKLLNVSPLTLNGWRTNKRYALPFVKVGRLVRYRRIDIEAFIASNLVSDL